MEVKFRKMNSQEYKSYCEYSINDYAKDLVKSSGITLEEVRRKGYATAALAEMEHHAMEDACTQSIIYVWKHNPPGVNLYTKCGYITFRESDDGLYMKKEL